MTSDAILTNAQGVPFERPRREDYPSDVDYLRAFHAYKDAVANEANKAFDEAFRNAFVPCVVCGAKTFKRSGTSYLPGVLCRDCKAFAAGTEEIDRNR